LTRFKCDAMDITSDGDLSVPVVPSPALRVLCVDDNPLVLEALGLKLSLLTGFHWLTPLSSADELVAEVRRQMPDVVLLDIDMPGRDPLEALAELTLNEPLTRVLMFSGLSRGDLVERAIDAGAWGFLSKHADLEAIVSAIHLVASGQFFLSEEYGDIAPQRLRRHQHGGVDPSAPR